MINGYLETSEVAKILGISTEAVLKLAHRGTLKSNFLRGRRLFESSVVDTLRNDKSYLKRSRRGTQLVKDTETPSIFRAASREPDSSGSSQTASREDESDLKAKEL